MPFLLDKQARILGKDIEKGAPLPLPITAENIERYVYEAVKTTAYLPTETEREYAARTKRYAQICSDAADGTPGVERVNDLITYNLDILTYADDAIAQMTERELFVFYFECLQKVTVLDPTCGSGAFLFAALNILLPLYQACINRIRFFTAQKARAGIATEHARFQVELKRIAQHDNERYYTVKSIIVNNLYGVDIMEEATEICKLRLFLRLAAEIKDAANIEPLPDIDFNIKAGNTLVGFATREQVKEALSTTLHGDAVQGKFLTGGETLADDAIAEVERKCKEVDRQYQGFHRMQISDGYKSSELADAKVQLRMELRVLNDELNRALAREYGIALPVEKGEARTTAGRKGKAPLNTLAENAAYQQWLRSHQPFHWFAEFYGILAGGGFDVIVGNPPYIEVQQVDYSLRDLIMLDSRAIHAMCIERSLHILHPDGCMSMIVPLSIVSTQRMQTLQQMLETDRFTWYANFSWRPGKLFDTVNRALTIFTVSCKCKSYSRTYSTEYRKWNSEARQTLISTIGFIDVARTRKYAWVPKLGDAIEKAILQKCLDINAPLSKYLDGGKHRIYYRTDGGLYWKVFTNFAPAFKVNGVAGHSSRETWFTVESANYAKAFIATLSSNTFWWWYTVTSNCRHLNPYDIENFPVPKHLVDDEDLIRMGELYLKDIDKNSTMLLRMQKQTGKTETQSFKLQQSKPIIDSIDRLLQKHYGFTDEELDFIINYDIKYRMGKDAAGDDE